MRHFLQSALLALLLGCQSEQRAADGSLPDNLAADSATDAARDSSLPAAAMLLALSGDGLMLVNGESGSTRALAFGTPGSEAIDVLTRVAGAVEERGTNQECGAGPVEFVSFGSGLQIVLQNNDFVGWTVRPPGDSTLRTMSNIGVGSTRAELESVYAAEVGASTLGMEFMAGGLQGILESASAGATITNLWAGVSCVAR